MAATPRRQSASIARIRGSLVFSAGTHPLSTCFDSGGRSYGSCDLVTDDRQRAGETLVAQRFRGAQPGQRRADDDDPALRLEGRYQVGDQRVRAHFVVLSAGGSISAMIACTGQDATARATRWRCESSARGTAPTVRQAPLPNQLFQDCSARKRAPHRDVILIVQAAPMVGLASRSVLCQPVPAP